MQFVRKANNLTFIAETNQCKLHTLRRFKQTSLLVTIRRCKSFAKTIANHFPINFLPRAVWFWATDSSAKLVAPTYSQEVVIFTRNAILWHAVSATNSSVGFRYDALSASIPITCLQGTESHRWNRPEIAHDHSFCMHTQTSCFPSSP